MRIEDMLDAHGLTKQVTYKEGVNPSEPELNEPDEPEFPVYGVKIDLRDPSPHLAVEYIDDAAGLAPAHMDFRKDEFFYGSWKNRFPFNAIKPCLLKNGEVTGYLNPNDYTQFEDGTSADITSGDKGDVMIEFPTVWWSFEKTDDYQYIRFSNRKVDENYVAYAHFKDDTISEKLYLSAYHVMKNNDYDVNRYVALSNRDTRYAPGHGKVAETRNAIKAQDPEYRLYGFYHHLMLQTLYTVMFKDLNSQFALGKGYAMSRTKDEHPLTGTTDKKGMFYGDGVGLERVKFCGIEDWYGNLTTIIDGTKYDASTYTVSVTKYDPAYTTTYENQVTYTKKVQMYCPQIKGDNELGFLPSIETPMELVEKYKQDIVYSSNTFYSDTAVFSDSGTLGMGEDASDFGTSKLDQSGAFHWNTIRSNYESLNIMGMRMAYLK